MRSLVRTRLGMALPAALAVAGAVLVGAAGGAASTAQAGAYELDDTWAVDDPDAEPIAIAVRSSGVSYTLNAPRRATGDFASLVRREPDGTVSGRYVVRGGEPSVELRPVAVAVTRAGELVVSTDKLLVGLDPAGQQLWHAPAGDGHPELGPAARGLAAGADGLFGTDLANGRVVGYDGVSGALRLRLGTTGTSPGAYLAPRDVAVGPGETLYVADFGNKRIQVLDAYGNPLRRWSLPARPVAVDVDSSGHTFALLDSDQVLVLDAGGIPLSRFGAPGRGVGQLQMASDLAVAADGRVLVVDRGNRRIVVFRPASGSGATPTAGADGMATTGPPERIRVAACPGQPATLDMLVDLGPRPPLADVMLLVDTTGSMEAVVSTAQARTTDLTAALAEAGDDVAIGLVDVRDYPYGEAGMATDWPWHLRGPLDTDFDSLATAVTELLPAGGGDAPEAYAGAIVGALDHPRAGWRAGARRILVILGDSVPRDDDLNEGISDPPVPGVWAPGQPARWRDSGPDWAPFTEDDLDWSDVLRRLAAEDVTVLVGVSGAAPDALSGQVGLLMRYWDTWLGSAGVRGRAIDLHEPGEMPEVLAALVARTVSNVELLEARAAPTGVSGWVAFAPGAHRGIDVPEQGATRSFGVSIEAPPGTPDGTYDLDLEAWGDGALYRLMPVALEWRSSCEPTPTPDGPIPSDTPAAAASTPTASATRTPPPSPATSPTPTSGARRVALLPLVSRHHCVPGIRPKADIVLSIDTSSSMDGDKIAAAVDSAGAFVGLLDMPRDHAGLVEFDGEARLAAGLTGSRATVLVALAGVSTSTGTRIDLGLGAALDELRSPRSRSDAVPVVVLLTDGRPDEGTAAQLRAESGTARAAGVTVFAIGLGEDVDGDLLAAVATDPSRYYFAPDTDELGAIYHRIAAGIPCR